MGVAWSHVTETRPGEVAVCPGAAGHLHSSRSLEESKRYWDNYHVYVHVHVHGCRIPDNIKIN